MRYHLKILNKLLIAPKAGSVSRDHAALTARLTETEQDAVFRLNAAAWYFTEFHRAK